MEKFNQWKEFLLSNNDFKEEILEMERNSDEIKERFYKQLEFGTGGMRGELGLGTNRLNVFTIRKAITGLAKYIEGYGKDAKKKGVVIAYDCRHQSEEFAKEIVKVLGHYKIKTYLFDELRPTPELSFAVRYLQAFAGIVITASHNPPQYNGVKIYGSDGGQMSLGMAEDITSFMSDIDNELVLPFSEFDYLQSNQLVQIIGKEIDEAYLKELESIRLNSKESSDVKIVFSPLHGTSHKLIPEGLKRSGFNNVQVVKEQMNPDPDFSSLTSPNPEDHEAFEYAIKYGERYHADLLMATDPDSDRLGIAVKNEQGQYIVLTGNQTGALMLNYLLEQKMINRTMPSNGVVLKTIVTSEIGRKIATSYGVKTIDTLTGFKFIGEKINEFNSDSSHKFLFGYEESYGYLIGEFVRDKDAIQAAMFIAEVAQYYKNLDMSLYEGLVSIWERYGYYQEDLVSVTLKGQSGAIQIQEMMDMIRNNPIHSLAGLQVQVIEDYALSQRTNIINGEKTIIDLPQSNVIKIHLEQDAWVTFRPSGTEPKIKFYFSVKQSTYRASEQLLEELKSEVLDMVLVSK